MVDISNPNISQHIKVVDDLVEEFAWNEKPVIYVFNKTDLISTTQRIIPPHCENRVFISARTGYNIELLLSKMKETIEKLSETKELFFPKQEEHKIYDLSRQAKILKKEEGSTGTLCYIKIASNQMGQWKKYLVSEKA